MAEKIVLVNGRDRTADWSLAPSICAAGDTLYGRNWGCAGDFPFLHFEACYYRAIDFAIAHRAEARRGRRPGPAQDPARLPADADLFGALDPRSRLQARPSPISSPASAKP